MAALTLAEFSHALEALEPDLPMALAISGGPDSMALLVLCAQWAKAARHCDAIYALTVDHGLRPEAKHEAANVAKWAQDLGVPHQILTWEGEKPKANVQASAREARYELMSDWCRAKGISTLVTAHHLDDQAETFLLRLIRGSGVDGLSAMQDSRLLDTGELSLRLIRPLLDVPRTRLTELLAANNQPFVEDPSNLDERYTRVRLRNVQSTFDEFGLTADRINQTAARMAQARDALEAIAGDVTSASVEAFAEGYLRLDCHLLMQAPRDIGLRVLAGCLKRVSGAIYGPRYERLERLYDAIADGSVGGGATLHGCQIVPEKGTVLIVREYRSAKGAVIEVSSNGPVPRVWDGRFLIGEFSPAGAPPFTIKALGEEGLSQAKAAQNTSELNWPPRIACLTLPAIWSDRTLVAACHLGLDLSQEHFGRSLEILFEFKGLSE